jgi:hypothetical protein
VVFHIDQLILQDANSQDVRSVLAYYNIGLGTKFTFTKAVCVVVEDDFDEIWFLRLRTADDEAQQAVLRRWLRESKHRRVKPMGTVTPMPSREPGSFLSIVSPFNCFK